MLLTGFEPFGGDSSNPSGDAVRLVATGWDRPEMLVMAVLPVTFAGAGARARASYRGALPRCRPRTGLAGGHSEIAVERVALNLITPAFPTTGALSRSTRRACRCAACTLLVSAGEGHGSGCRGDRHPGRPVDWAGTFVCKHVFFVAAERAASTPGMRVGFVHVPWVDGRPRTAKPSDAQPADEHPSHDTRRFRSPTSRALSHRGPHDPGHRTRRPSADGALY